MPVGCTGGQHRLTDVPRCGSDDRYVSGPAVHGPLPSPALHNFEDLCGVPVRVCSVSTSRRVASVLMIGRRVPGGARSCPYRTDSFGCTDTSEARIWRIAQFHRSIASDFDEVSTVFR